MSVLFEVTEGSTAWLDVSFYGKDGALETPATVVYEIWDVASGTQIKGETSLPSASQVEITLSSADNRILGQEHFREARKAIVTASYSGSEKLIQDYVYHVRNIDYKST